MRVSALLLVSFAVLPALCCATKRNPSPLGTAVLRGKVVDATTDKAIPGALVSWRSGKTKIVGSTTSKGEYAFAVPVGSGDDKDRTRHVELSVRANGYRQAQNDSRVPSLGVSSDVSFKMNLVAPDKIGTLDGKVVNARTGQAIGGATVEVLNAGGNLVTTTRPDGTYTIPGIAFSSGLSVRVSASAPPCFWTVEQPLDLNRAKSDQNFSLISQSSELPLQCPKSGLFTVTDLPVLPDASNIKWSQADKSAIQMDANQDAWNSGHIEDILKLSIEVGFLVCDRRRRCMVDHNTGSSRTTW